MAETKLMDTFQFKQKKKAIDMAIFISSKAELLKARDEFLEQLKLTPPEQSIQGNVDALLQRAELQLKKWEEHGGGTPEPAEQNPRGEFARKLSLKTQARLSHLKLMKKDNFVENVPVDEKIPKMDCFARCICMCMDRLKTPFNQVIAKELHKVASEISAGVHDQHITKSHLEEVVNEHMDVINKSTYDIENVAWSYELHSTAAKGKRNYFEDRFLILPNLNELVGVENVSPLTFCGIYDGHGGDAAAEYARQQLHLKILRNPHFPKDVETALKEAFLETDVDFLKLGLASGTTATALLIVGDQLYIANVGDSTAVLVEKKIDAETSTSKLEASKVSMDHRASDENEKKRIKDKGGLVLWFQGGWRVNGVMAVSRSIGDASLGSVVIAEPTIFTKKLTENDQYVILATDGLWDVMTPTEAMDFVNQWRAANGDKEDYGNVSFELTQEAKKRSSADDVTVVVVFLQEKGKGFRKDRSEILQDS